MGNLTVYLKSKFKRGSLPHLEGDWHIIKLSHITFWTRDYRNRMWPLSTSYQSEADEGLDGSQTSVGSITSSIGVIGRKNLRADAPVFKASNSEIPYSPAYDSVGVEASAGSGDENYYNQEDLIEYPQM